MWIVSLIRRSTLPLWYVTCLLPSLSSGQPTHYSVFHNQKFGFELNISGIVNNERDTAGMESLFSEVMREVLRFLAFSQLTDELEVRQHGDGGQVW